MFMELSGGIMQVKRNKGIIWSTSEYYWKKVEDRYIEKT